MRGGNGVREFVKEFGGFQLSTIIFNGDRKGGAPAAIAALDDFVPSDDAPGNSGGNGPVDTGGLDFADPGTDMFDFG